MPFYLMICLFLLTIVSNSVGACSIYCGEDERVCANSIFDGYIGSDCKGLEGCSNSSTPCNEECPRHNPVLSDDKSYCSRCQVDYDGSKICPECVEDKIWCKAEKTCKKKTEVCGEACNSVYFPILNENGQFCESCPEPTKWCSAEQKCFDPQTSPCNKRCYVGCDGCSRYCAKNNTCIGYDEPCGTQCSMFRHYCIEDRTCKWRKQPCGQLCPKGRKYCFVEDACILDTETCPCSNDRWGCRRFDEVANKYHTHCNVLHNETLPEGETDCVVTTVNYRSSSHIDPGYCHPSSELCPGTMKTCVPKHLKLSIC